MTWAWWFATVGVLFFLVSYMAFRISRLYGQLADLNGLVAKMLVSDSFEQAKGHAEQFARERGYGK